MTPERVDSTRGEGPGFTRELGRYAVGALIGFGIGAAVGGIVELVANVRGISIIDPVQVDLVFGLAGASASVIGMPEK